MSEQPLVRVLMQNDFVSFIHNDVANAAYFIHERLKATQDSGVEHPGLFLELIALVSMTASALEGYANYLGYRMILPEEKTRQQADPSILEAITWEAFERKPVIDKLKVIAAHHGMTVDWGARPYQTVRALVNLRNLFAHPKPVRPKDREFVAEGRHSDLAQQLRDYRPEYEEQLTWPFADQAYVDVEAIWKKMLEGAGIEVHETWSGGPQGFSLLENLDEGKIK